MPIANKIAKIAIMMSSCRLPPNLLAAGIHWNCLTLYFMPTDYEHLHQTVKFWSINSVPPLQSDQCWRMGSPWYFSYLTYILDLDATLMLEVLRWSICHPTLYGGTDAGDAPLPMINPPDHALYAYMFSQHWETVAPICCSRNLWNTPTDCQDCRCARPHFSERRISGLLAR